MAHRTSRVLAALALGACSSASLPRIADAQTSTFYSPPRVIRQGKNASPTSSGTVEVKVFVKKTGAVGSASILKSSNHADDAAALEIAKSSTYKPGARDAKPIDAYYTYVLRFTGSGVASGGGSAASGSGLGQANALVRAGKYDQAKTVLQSYLTAHPGDASAQVLLGVADSYLNDNAGAAAAFDAAGTIPANFKTVAAKAYADAAVDAIKAKNTQQAVTYANKGVAVQQTANGLYVQGVAYLGAQQYRQATAALEQAKSLASSGKSDASSLNTIDTELVQAYMLGGQQQKGLALAQELKRRDPSNAHVDDAIGAYYNQQGRALAQSGKVADAVSQYEAGAKAVPGSAAILYDNAAQVLAQNAKTKDDWQKVKAETDKALAVKPTDPLSLFLQGVALGNAGDLNGAKASLTKAKANVGSDAQLSAQIDAQLAQLAKLGQK